ncbi:MAG: radical SAM protein [Nitrospiraceae bacterium]|nr:MAG: radical SAM protein [Nitrospiraceae bacterium]
MITLINHQGLKAIRGIQIQNPAPHIGLAYLGAFLKKNGHNYTAIDACGEALDQILSYEDKNDIMIQGLTVSQIIPRIPSDTRIFGFSCSFSHYWVLVSKIAAAIRREFPEALFVAGGEHPTAMPGHILNEDMFNVVVMGEGEETFLELARRVENDQTWDDIDGIAYKNREGQIVQNSPRKRITNIDEIPYPDWDNWCLTNYIEHKQIPGINLGRSMPILGSRGCPYGCAFCSNGKMWKRRYIMRSGRSIVDEMEYMKNKYNVDSFSFYDSTFIVNRDKTISFCQELIRRKLDITYKLPAGTRCEVFDEELALLLERSGLRNFMFALESGSEEIRKIIKKNISMKNFLKAVKAVKKTKMTVGCFIVIGFPEDNKKSLKQTLSIIRKLAFIGMDDITVSKFTPYPGSEYFDDLYRKGYFNERLEELGDLISFFKSDTRSYCEALSSRQLYHWMNWMFVNFYIISFLIRPWKLIKSFWDYYARGVETTRYMRFFSDRFLQRRKWKTSKV